MDAGPLPPPLIAAGIVLALSVSGFFQGLTGFGFGLLSVALLPLLVGIKDALVVAALLNVVVCAATFSATWRHFRWKDCRGLVLGACLGVPLGFWALVRLDAALLLRALGVLLAAYAAIELLVGERSPVRIAPAMGFPMGLASGAVGGALNVGGPPAIAYAYSQPWPKEQVVAVLQVVFGLAAVLRLGLVASSELVRAPLVNVALLSIPPMLAATLWGGRLLRVVPQRRLKACVFGFLFLMGIKYVWAA